MINPRIDYVLNVRLKNLVAGAEAQQIHEQKVAKVVNLIHKSIFAAAHRAVWCTSSGPLAYSKPSGCPKILWSIGTTQGHEFLAYRKLNTTFCALKLPLTGFAGAAS